jgi:hypothetical protein
MPDDEDRAREIMNAFFRPATEVPGEAPSALIMPGAHHECPFALVRVFVRQSRVK